MADPERFINQNTNQPISLSNAPNSIFGSSGASAAIGLVPVPSTVAGTTNFLREDGTWAVPPGSVTVFTSIVSGVVANPHGSISPPTIEYVLNPDNVFRQPTGDQLLGTSTNDNATTGNVGEYIASVLASTVAVQISSSQSTMITSFALGAGDWDAWVQGTVSSSVAGQNIQYATVSFSSTSTTQDTTPNRWAVWAFNPTAGGNAQPFSLTPGAITLYTGITRISVATCTTFFMMGAAGPSAANVTYRVWGAMQARRVR